MCNLYNGKYISTTLGYDDDGIVSIRDGQKYVIKVNILTGERGLLQH